MKVVIVGGVAGGASLAARLRRLDENAQIVMFERGSYISFANCGLPYYIGGIITDRDELLLQTPESMGARFDVDVRINSEVVGIDSAERTYKGSNSFVLIDVGIGGSDIGRRLVVDVFNVDDEVLSEDVTTSVGDTYSKLIRWRCLEVESTIDD